MSGEVYNAHDSDKNGVLTLDEAKLAFKALGAWAKPVDNFDTEFNKVANPDGVITFEEFKHFVKLA